MTDHDLETERVDDDKKAMAALLTFNAFLRLIHKRPSLWADLMWTCYRAANSKPLPGISYEPDTGKTNDEFLAAYEKYGR